LELTTELRTPRKYIKEHEKLTLWQTTSSS